MSQETDFALLTEEEKALFVDDDTKEFVDTENKVDTVAPDVVEDKAVEDLAVITDDTKVDVEPEQVVEVTEVVEPLEATFRYPEVALTDTVPAELATQLSNIEKKLEEGELDVSQYMNQRALIDRQITAFQIKEAQEQRAYNNWMDAQDTFLSQNRQYIDSKILYGALDKAVQEVQSDIKYKSYTPLQVLVAADGMVKSAFGVKSEKEVQSTKSVVNDKQTKPSNTLPNIPTLSNVPASSANVVGDDPFSSIDRLTGDLKEAALAKLSPEQYDAYLKG